MAKSTQQKAAREIAEYLKRLLDERFFKPDELPEYRWLRKKLKEALP